MKQIIHINELWCDAIIGIHAFEKAAAQPLCIDAELTIDATAAIASDNIRDTLDYYSTAQTLKDCVQREPRELLERLLHELLAQLKTDTRIQSARLTLSKPNALADFGAMVRVSGEFTR